MQRASGQARGATWARRDRDLHAAWRVESLMDHPTPPPAKHAVAVQLSA